MDQTTKQKIEQNSEMLIYHAPFPLSSVFMWASLTSLWAFWKESPVHSLINFSLTVSNFKVNRLNSSSEVILLASNFTFLVVDFRGSTSTEYYSPSFHHVTLPKSVSGSKNWNRTCAVFWPETKWRMSCVLKYLITPHCLTLPLCKFAI